MAGAKFYGISAVSYFPVATHKENAILSVVCVPESRAAEFYCICITNAVESNVALAALSALAGNSLLAVRRVDH